MELTDGRGRPMDEVTIRLNADEVTDLLVATSRLDGGGADHAVVHDSAGSAVALYRQTGAPTALERSTDWWVGPLILVAALFMIVGAYTIARGLLGLLF
ncbi:MAG: hypothetical protein ACT4OM_02855 [Actinomycetota bacterium]